MKKNVVIMDPVTGDSLICKDVIKSLKINGTYLPAVSRVVFNLKTTENVPAKNEDGSEKKVPAKNKNGNPILDKHGNPIMKTVYETKRLDEPILVTKVWWADNTTTTVRNSKYDKVVTEFVDVEGTKVETASEQSKTVGIIYAIVKRTCGVPDDNGEMVDTNLGKILTNIVESGYDQKVEEAKTKIQKAKAKAAFEARNNKASKDKASKKKYSHKELLQFAGPILEALSAKIAENPEVLFNILNDVKKA